MSTTPEPREPGSEAVDAVGRAVACLDAIIGDEAADTEAKLRACLVLLQNCGTLARVLKQSNAQAEAGVVRLTDAIARTREILDAPELPPSPNPPPTE